jgi:hypothetical protein
LSQITMKARLKANLNQSSCVQTLCPRSAKVLQADNNTIVLSVWYSDPYISFDCDR